VEVDLGAPGAQRHADELGRGGLFIPGHAMPLASECDVVIYGCAEPIVVTARVVFSNDLGIAVDLEMDAGLRAVLVAVARGEREAASAPPAADPVTARGRAARAGLAVAVTSAEEVEAEALAAGVAEDIDAAFAGAVLGGAEAVGLAPAVETVVLGRAAGTPVAGTPRSALLAVDAPTEPAAAPVKQRAASEPIVEWSTDAATTGEPAVVVAPPPPPRLATEDDIVVVGQAAGDGLVTATARRRAGSSMGMRAHEADEEEVTWPGLDPSPHASAQREAEAAAREIAAQLEGLGVADGFGVGGGFEPHDSGEGSDGLAVGSASDPVTVSGVDEVDDADAIDDADGRDGIDDDLGDEPLGDGLAEGSVQGDAATLGRAPRNVFERLRGLNPNEQAKVARTGEQHERIALERLYGKSVWEQLLRNPRITPPEVARIARMGTLPRPQLEVIVGNAAWLGVPEVRRALMTNPRLTAEMIPRVLHHLPKHELKLVPTTITYTSAVREHARRLLKAGS
jgi:hypothetical protein